MTSVLLNVLWTFLGPKFDLVIRLNALLVRYILPENSGLRYNYKIIGGLENLLIIEVSICI